MREFQGRRKAKSWLYSKLVLIVLFILAILLVKACWQMYRRYRFTMTERAKAEMLVVQLEEKKRHLEATVALSETAAGVDKMIREKFAVVRDGEYVVTVIDRDKDKAPTTTPKIHWWQKLFKR